MDPLKKLTALDPTKKAFSLIDEFRNFAFKGNVIDLAVGVIIGVAFGKIVDSLVKNIFMPFIDALIPSKRGYVDWKWTMDDKEIRYGLFLGEVVNFLIVTAVLFVFIVKFLGWVMRTKEQEAAAPLPPTKDQELLMEIRDLLKQQKPA
mgnify:CR=1 FL=1